NALTRALQDYGRLLKSIYVLKWYEDEAYRRRICTQLNKGESLHSLRSSFHIANQGYVGRNDSDGLTNQVNCLNLVTNAVITWNKVYMGAAIEQMKKEGHIIREEDIQHVWPTR
ncbi:MAG: transposase, partial [Bacteroidetes bacterium]|nr:transposase [Bacteroidota bacterium]